jgi:phosphoserine phosphatase
MKESTVTKKVGLAFPRSCRGCVDFFFLRCYNIPVAIRVVFFDCDGTLTKVKSSWEYLHRRFGLWEKKADQYQQLFRQGTINYEEFCQRDALLWKGRSFSSVHEVVCEIPYQAGARACVDGLRARGVCTIMVSAGLSFLVNKVRGELGIDKALSNHLVVEKGCLTGEVRLEVHHDDKGRIVQGLLSSLGFSAMEAAAVGDGEGDRGMFEAVGVPIGFHPQQSLSPLLRHVLSDHSLLPVLSVVDQYG